MALSSNPRARARQLANLRPGSGAATLGNARAVSHGATATAKTLPVDGKARAIYNELAAETPLRDGDGSLPVADRTVVEMLALCLCRIESIAHWLTMHGVLDASGEPRAAVELERRLRAEAADHCAALGLTPRSRVALGLDLQRAQAATLAELLSDLPEEEG